jgi:hypothetical protein
MAYRVWWETLAPFLIFKLAIVNGKEYLGFSTKVPHNVGCFLLSSWKQKKEKKIMPLQPTNECSQSLCPKVLKEKERG